MPAYDWVCLACSANNDAVEEKCGKCGCPAAATTGQVEAIQSQNGRKRSCIKCGCEEFETGEMRASGGLFSSLFEVESKKFWHFSCAKCGYTEFYNAKKGTLSNILDFLVS